MISKIFNYGVTEETPFTERKYIQVTNSTCVIGSLFSIIYWPATLATGNAFLIIYYFAVPLLCVYFIYLNHIGKRELARLLTFGLMFIFAVSMTPIFGFQLFGYLWLFPIIAGLTVFFPRRNVKSYLVFSLLCIVFYVPSYLFNPQVEPIYIANFEMDQIVLKTAPIFTLICTFLVVLFARKFMIEGDIMFEKEHERAESLLLNMLPEKIAKRLKLGETAIADQYADVSVMFIKVVGFPTLSGKSSAEEVIHTLNGIFSVIDSKLEQFDAEKIKTMGNGYLIAAGLDHSDQTHAQRLCTLAIQLQSWISQSTFAEQGLALRIGINSGPVVAGVIGRQKYIYDLWGDTVNLASRLESQGVVNQSLISESTLNCLGDDFETEFNQEIDLKGKGIHKTWFVKKTVAQQQSNAEIANA